jgi:hypothetical protein
MLNLQSQEMLNGLYDVGCWCHENANREHECDWLADWVAEPFRQLSPWEHAELTEIHRRLNRWVGPSPFTRPQLEALSLVGESGQTLLDRPAKRRA